MFCRISGLLGSGRVHAAACLVLDLALPSKPFAGQGFAGRHASGHDDLRRGLRIASLRIAPRSVF
jgi:hypothetical protein